MCNFFMYIYVCVNRYMEVCKRISMCTQLSVNVSVYMFVCMCVLEVVVINGRVYNSTLYGNRLQVHEKRQKIEM